MYKILQNSCDECAKENVLHNSFDKFYAYVNFINFDMYSRHVYLHA